MEIQLIRTFTITAITLGIIFGIAIPYIFIRKYRFTWKFLSIGIGLLLITIIVQPFIQLGFLAVITGKYNITKLHEVIIQNIKQSPTYLVIYSIIIGYIAGTFQPILKYIVLRFVKEKLIDKSIFLGYGFGIAEVLFILIPGMVVLYMEPQELEQYYTHASIIDTSIHSLYVGYERFLATLFHIYSTGLVLIGLLIRSYVPLVIVIILHGFIDAWGAWMQFKIITSKITTMTYLLTTMGLVYVIMTSAVLLILYVYRKFLLKIKE